MVSYADSGMNHCGYIYQATNWIYTGATKELKGPPASPIGAGTVITPLQPESLLMDKYKNVQKIDNNSGFIH